MQHEQMALFQKFKAGLTFENIMHNSVTEERKNM